MYLSFTLYTMDPDRAGSRQLCVVLDANQWRAQFGLRTRLGVALLYTLHQLDGVIGLPEVVEQELVKHLTKAGVKAVGDIEKSLESIQRSTGSVPAVNLPSEEELEKAARERLQELERILVRVPISIEQTHRVLDRVAAGRSPNRRREQFKDSWIWEAVKELAATYEVHLVTNDIAAFFENDVTHGMASDLREECADEQLAVKLHNDVAACLRTLQPAVPRLDTGRLAWLILKALERDIEASVSTEGFIVGGLTDQEVEAFATEQVDRLAMTFRLTGNLIDRELSATGSDRQGTFSVTGECGYVLSTEEVVGAAMSGLEVPQFDDLGDEKRSVTVFVRAGTAYLGGQPPRRLEIREPVAGTADST